MNFQEAIVSGFNNYFNFKDRASRSEFWYWTLFAFLVGIVAQVLDAVVFGAGAQVQPLNLISSLALLAPGLAVSVRRLHDVDKSGWWLLIALTVIGILFPLLYWNCKKGDDGVNRFGSNPLAAAMPRR